MPARIMPAAPPYSAHVQAQLDRLTPPGMPALTLFTTMATDERLFHRLSAGALLDRGNITLRQREIVIGRITALGGCEYEWGVHVALFADRAGLTKDQIYSLVHGNAEDACWADEKEQSLIRTCDALHASCTVSAGLWDELAGRFTEASILEVLMLAGFYRTITYLANATELPLESFAKRFPAEANR